MICPKCGKDNKEHSAFCTGCGEKLHSHEYSTQQIKEDVEKYSTKKSSKPLIIVLIICSTLILTTIIGVAAYVIVTQNKNTFDSVHTEQPATEEPTELPPEKATDLDMSKIQNIIGNYDATSNTGISIVDFNHSCYIFPIKNTDAIDHHFASTNVLRVPHQNHTIPAQLPKIPANDSYVFCAPIHA